jgi:cytochrome b
MSRGLAPNASMRSAPSDQDRVAVTVWDWPVRAVHWAMVVLLVTLIITGELGGNALQWHMRAGAAMLALLLFRIAWGFAGTRHARFAHFLRAPRAVWAYASNVSHGAYQRSVGHNPLGGWSIVLMLTLLLAQVTTGLFANDQVATDAPLARFISEDLSNAMAWFHRRNLWVLIGVVILHIGAVLYFRFALKTDLIGPMIDGVNFLPAHAAVPAEPPRGWRAFALLAVCGGIAVFIVTR